MSSIRGGGSSRPRAPVPLLLSVCCCWVLPSFPAPCLPTGTVAQSRTGARRSTRISGQWKVLQTMDRAPMRQPRATLSTGSTQVQFNRQPALLTAGGGKELSHNEGRRSGSKLKQRRVKDDDARLTVSSQRHDQSNNRSTHKKRNEREDGPRNRSARAVLGRSQRQSIQRLCRGRTD